MNTLFPQQNQNDVITGKVQPLPSREALAAFGHDIASGLTPDQQHEAIRRMIDRTLSDTAIAGHDTISSPFELGRDRIDPDLWDRIQNGELYEALAQQAMSQGSSPSVEGAKVVDLTEYRRQKEQEMRDILAYAPRAGSALGVWRAEVMNGEKKVG